MSKPYIICVDDEPAVLEALVTQLKSHLGDGFIYEQAERGEEALTLFEEILALKREVAVVISDQMMPGMKGHEFLTQVYKQSPNTIKILLTGITTTEELGLALNQAKLYRYISKPWERYDLQMTVEEATKTFKQRSEIAQYTSLLEVLVQANTEMAQQRSIADLLAVFMKYVIEGSEADRGGVVVLDAYAAPLKKLFYRKKNKDIDFYDHDEEFPAHVFEAVRRCDETILVLTPYNNTLVSEQYLNTHKPRSIFAKSLWHDEDLLGILYLESTIRKNNFTSNKMKFLELLCNDAALTLSKLKLINSLEHTIEQRTSQVVKQNSIIEEANKDFVESIQYASRVQNSFMPLPEDIAKHFPNTVVYHRPKSIISGDFYWLHDSEAYLHFAVVDCTGHGVPGGMMSMLGMNLLQRIITEDENRLPDDVLAHMNQYFRERYMRGAGKQGYADSMDIAMCALHKPTNKLYFSGARRPLHVLRQNKVEEIRGDNFSLGGSHVAVDAVSKFTLHEVPIQSGDAILMFTDGLTDQFGGQRNKKFSLARLRAMAQQWHGKTSTAIQADLEATMTNWQDGGEQTDDILGWYICFDHATLQQAQGTSTTVVLA